jgi:hypothetical protein
VLNVIEDPAMAFQNQFALSLELTSLLPLATAAAGKTYDAAMKLARELQVGSLQVFILFILSTSEFSIEFQITCQGSGSSIIVEEDLAEIFGRARIDRNLESSFRTIISGSERNGLQELCEQLALYCGPGSTVLRAFDDPPYMAMLVQCRISEFHQ